MVFGKASGFAANIDTRASMAAMASSLEASLGGLVTAASAGDVNDDGFADMIVGYPGDTLHGFGTGASYVVFGKASEIRRQHQPDEPQRQHRLQAQRRGEV